jgi:hypothetical protein
MKSFKMLIGCVAAATALLLASAPAGATNNTLTATGGQLNTAVGNFVLGSGGTTPPCGASTGGITVDIGAVSGGVHATSVVSSNISTSFVFSGNTYIVDITRAASGTHTGSINASTLAVSQNTRLVASVYLSPSCVKGTLACTATVNFASAGILTGSISAAPSAAGVMATGDSVTLSGTGPVVVTGCPSPLDILGGSSASLSSVVFTK